MRRLFALALVSLSLAACGNDWIMKDPPRTCAAMCRSWGMDLAAIVGVGKQDRAQGAGATACVCRAPGAAASAPGATASASELSDLEYQAAAYAAIPPEVARRDAQQQQQQQQAAMHH